MADNYLEKKYDEYLHGKSVIHRANPSLDSLLDYLAREDGKPDGGYIVRQAQLDAAVRSAQKLGIPAEITTDESAAEIRISCSSPAGLGQLILAARLKAAELKLRSEVSLEETSAGAVIRLYR